MQSDNLNELFAALAKASAEMPIVLKNKIANFLTKSGVRITYKYADLTDVIEVCRPYIAKFGLSVLQLPQCRGTDSVLITTLAHSSGQFISSELFLERNINPQTFGSYLTYMRRYGYCAILSISSEEDDDGLKALPENASKEKIKQPEKPVENKISKEQSSFLQEALNKCDDKYLKTIWDHLKKNNIHELKDLPVSLYDKLCAGAFKNAKEVVNV